MYDPRLHALHAVTNNRDSCRLPRVGRTVGLLAWMCTWEMRERIARDGPMNSRLFCGQGLVASRLGALIVANLVR